MLKTYSESSDDRSLWSRFLAGDDKAYAEIYKTYLADMYSYGMRFTSDQELLKDCLQDVFVKIYSNRSNLNSTDNIKLYLFTALKNALFNVFQKDKAVYHVDTIEPVFSTEYSVEEQWIANEQDQERQAKMKQILDTLTPRQREVIYYRYVEGMKLDDICKIMEMNYQSVQNLIQRSIRKVKSTFPEKEQATVSINLISRCL